MNKNIQILFPNFSNWTNSIQSQTFRLILVLLSGVLLIQVEESKSEEIFLKCIGKYETSRFI